MSQFIHLLYVPTMNCNLKCRYCYLGDMTGENACTKGYLETLEYAVEKFRSAHVIPFNISLHGGEVTTLSPDAFRSLVAYISKYYELNRSLLQENGFKVGTPHIKTNLYQIDKHLDAIKEFDVSISGSLDLPLSLHEKYRVTKGGKGTLDTIMKNIELLRALPNKKKVSATIFKEHFDHLDEIVHDIRFLADHTCLDMNAFNFMIGFAYGNEVDYEVQLTPLSETDQEKLYERMHEAYEGSDLEKGLNESWFAEFTPAYCTNCDNCGEKFFLLERNGDIYSCVRGQGHPEFFYGNIYEDTVETILANAKTKIFIQHNAVGFPEECGKCEYLHLCKTGCPFVKSVYKSGKSYTCLLQKKLYKNGTYEEIKPNFTYWYLKKNHPEIANDYRQEIIPENSLKDLIRRDKKLQMVYDKTAFVLSVNGVDYPLESQILKDKRDIIYINPDTALTLYIKKEIMDALADYPVYNTLYIQLLSGDTVVYGDEQREKQAHVMTHQIYKYALDMDSTDREGFYRVDMAPLIRLYANSISKVSPNNLFVTTGALRDYHYWKQKNNGFYHINALNLPFQNIEFMYFDMHDDDLNE
ncbi:MAG: radical SAM protein [Clostridia bacterium]|nr:radical SAM protein [Clostridia bacterium]